MFFLPVSIELNSAGAFDTADKFLALGVHQFFLKVIAFQWIFAFVIMSALFVATCGIAIPGFFGKELTFGRNTVVNEDQERAPLLNEEV